MSEKITEIQPIHTACKNCVYAKYENITQTDCYLDYINKFKEKNLEIIEAYDNEKEFYVINNKKCIGYRDNSWFEKRKLSHLSLEEKISRHFDTNYIKYTLIINLDKFDTLDKLHNLSQIIATSNIAPAYIIFIRFHGKHVDLHTLDNIQSILKTANLNNTKWRLQTMLDPDMGQDQIIYDCIKLNEKRFIAVISDIPTNFKQVIEHANTIVSEDMNSFNIISNSSKSIIIFPVSVYKYFLHVLKQYLISQDELYTVV